MHQKEASLSGKRTLSEEERLTIDSLTGLGNDFLFRHFLLDEFINARECHTNGALLAIKLDKIIEINMLHGRSGGDEALRAVAHLLDNYRADHKDIAHRVFRLGGPVYSYFIPGCNISEARTTAEEIHQQVQKSELYLKKLTVSIGIVTLSEFFLNKETPDHIALGIELTALKRLNLAEKQGTNTICDTSRITESIGSERSTILVIEPDRASIELLIRAMEAAAFKIHTCSDGESALSFIRTTPPAVIICEVMTPMVNGFVLREKLRTNALWNTIPFILISHKKNEEYIRKAVERDIRYFFRKPLSIIEIVGLVSNITRSITQ